MNELNITLSIIKNEQIYNITYVLVQLCFSRFPIDGFSGKWWSK